MNAIDVLKADHRRLDELFEEFDSASGFTEKLELFGEIKEVLDTHTQLEEAYFYPVFAEREGFHDVIDESYDEHAEIREIIAEIEALSNPEAEDEFDSRMEELIDSVEHHVGEEESELFPKVQEVCRPQELDDLGGKLEQARKRYTTKAA